MPARDCADPLDPEILERFVLEDLPEADAQRVALHLSACAPCEAARESVHENLQHLDHLRALTPTLEAGRARSTLLAGLLPESIAGYRVQEEIGRGGMGIVYLAEQAQPRRRVALKVIHPSLLGDEARRRFSIEAQALARLNHAGIARVYETGLAVLRDGGSAPFLAMEFVQGPRLDDVLRDSPGLGETERVALWTQICSAVHHAHVHGVVHRDLKPGNIRIAEESGEPKVLDFGVARLLDEDTAGMEGRTSTGQLVGTIPYMSPEQVLGDPAGVDARSDVYSLGVLGFFMLTGRLPYAEPAGSTMGMAHEIREGRVLRLREAGVDCASDLEIIVQTALSRDRELRYQSAAELAADLRRYTNAEPIAARAPSVWYHLRTFARRNRALVMLASVSLVALVVAAGAALWQGERAKRERAMAEGNLQVAREAAGFLISGISARLASRFGATEFQLELHEVASTYYRELLANDPSDLEVRRGLYRSLSGMADPLIANGERRRALALLEEAHELVSGVAAQYPDSESVQSDLGYTLQSLGNLHAAAGRLDQAGEAFQASLVRFEGLPGRERKRAQMLRLLGDVRAEQREEHEARACYASAIALCRRLVEGFPGEPYYSRELAQAELAASRHARLAGDLAAARIHVGAARTSIQQALGQQPEHAMYLMVQAGIDVEDAALALSGSDPNRARMLAERSLRIYEPLFASDPRHFVLYDNVALVYEVLARASKLQADEDVDTWVSKALEARRIVLEVEEPLVRDVVAYGRLLFDRDLVGPELVPDLEVARAALAARVHILAESVGSGHPGVRDLQDLVR